MGLTHGSAWAESLDGWAPTTAAAGGCAAACDSSAALSFRAFQGSTSVDTMLCAAQTADAQWTLGFESSTGCVTSTGASTTTSADYQCRCKAQDQLQGLALPVQGSCVAGCQQGFEGSSGEGAMHMRCCCCTGLCWSAARALLQGVSMAPCRSVARTPQACMHAGRGLGLLAQQNNDNLVIKGLPLLLCCRQRSGLWQHAGLHPAEPGGQRQSLWRPGQ